MKKIIFSTLIVASLTSMSFGINNLNGKNTSKTKTCEYSFFVKCAGSNQFVQVIRAKDQSTAKTMCKNQYPNCTVNTKDANGKNCN